MNDVIQSCSQLAAHLRVEVHQHAPSTATPPLCVAWSHLPAPGIIPWKSDLSTRKGRGEGQKAHRFSVLLYPATASAHSAHLPPQHPPSTSYVIYWACFYLVSCPLIYSCEKWLCISSSEIFFCHRNAFRIMRYTHKSLILSFHTPAATPHPSAASPKQAWRCWKLEVLFQHLWVPQNTSRHYPKTLPVASRSPWLTKPVVFQGFHYWWGGGIWKWSPRKFQDSATYINYSTVKCVHIFLRRPVFCARTSKLHTSKLFLMRHNFELRVLWALLKCPEQNLKHFYTL